ncbi:hypothetical protein [Agromyces larvae]|uniref:DUF4386 family protein n=1 Tax=Agromyces larvae TaxID=2929802 RepID=A0ABY4C5U4_9MICO|nr:hypothetical protein [Agromyces larvae]UOE45797.1 hypothetical protein MTO99_08650 [Agromyces larvae]
MPSPSRLRTAALLSFGVAAVYAALVVVAATGSAELADHASGAGRATEALAGAAFVVGAIALMALTPRPGILWWLPGIVGLAASGITMIVTAISGAEPPFWLFVSEAVLTAVGLVIVSVSAVRRRVLPWWAAIGIALILPIMFLVPMNGIVLVLVWAAVGIGALRASAREAADSPTPAVAMLRP